MRLDLALIRRHPGLSRRKARDVIEKGQVSVDGERVREAGRDVPEAAEIVFDPNRPALPRARSTLPVLYEDDHVIVVDKPAGLLSVPTSGLLREDTALGRVQDYARRRSPRRGYAERVHRLDRDTTGAIAFALSHEARAGLIDAFRSHRIERVYLAIVEGHPPAERGTIDAPVRARWESGRRGVAAPGEARLAARTHYTLRERFALASLVELSLETGRQHQVRAHLAHLGLPILGDSVYGGQPHARRRAGPVPARRPMLHAARLAFDHPVSGARVAVECAPPSDFSSVLTALRRQPPRGEPAWQPPSRKTPPAPRPQAPRAPSPPQSRSSPPRSPSIRPHPPRPPRSRRRRTRSGGR